MYILFDFYIPNMHGEIRQAKNIQTVADLCISIKNKLQEYKLLYFFWQFYTLWYSISHQ